MWDFFILFNLINLIMTEKQKRDLVSKRDGRLLRLFVHKTSKGLVYKAWFNNDELSTHITKEQYERYKPLCTFCDTIGDSIVEHLECAPSDNGLPKWFNKIF